MLRPGGAADAGALGARRAQHRQERGAAAGAGPGLHLKEATHRGVQTWLQ